MTKWEYCLLIWHVSDASTANLSDVRELQRQLKTSGVKMIAEADENSTGPAGFLGQRSESPLRLMCQLQRGPLGVF